MVQLSFHCERCQKQFVVDKIEPVINCIECNNSNLCLHIGLTREYVNSKEFKNMIPSVWKYLPRLVSHKGKIISLNEGGTPLRLSNISTEVGIRNLKIK